MRLPVSRIIGNQRVRSGSRFVGNWLWSLVEWVQRIRECTSWRELNREKNASDESIKLSSEAGPSGVAPPLALSQLRGKLCVWQAAWRRCRRCLLKGCEAAFRPHHPLSRYCSAACRQAARAWSRWWAAFHYRASEHGKARRAEQARRRRERQDSSPDTSRDSPAMDSDPPVGEVSSATVSTGTIVDSSVGEVSSSTLRATTVLDASGAAVLDSSRAAAAGCCPAEREGHHDHGSTKKNCCHRPGCYERFEIPDRSPLKKFCNADCRQALRRVLERERRLRAKVAG